MTASFYLSLWALFGDYPYSMLLFDPATGWAPAYIWHRRRGTRAFVPVPLYDTMVDLCPFTALRFPA